MSMSRLPELLASAEELKAIAAAHGAGRLAVFGSVARGEDGPESDIDLLYEYTAPRSLIETVRMQADFERLLEVPVDVVAWSCAKDREGHITAEAIYL